MPRRKFKLFLLILGDITLLYAAMFAALTLRYLNHPDPTPIIKHIAPFSLVFLLWIILLGAFGLYDFRFIKNSKHFLYRLLRAMATNTVIAVLVFYLLPVFEIEPRRNLFLIALVATLFIFFWRYLFNLLIIKAPAAKVLFFGINYDAKELAEYLLKNPQLGLRPVAFMALSGQEKYNPLPLPHFTQEDNLLDVIKNFGIDTVVILREIKENRTLVTMLFQVIPLGVAVLEFPAFYEMSTGKIPLSLIGEVWFLENLVGIRKTAYEFFKRALDIFLSLLLGVPALVIFPFIALVIIMNSKGPVLFHQKRMGKNGKVFDLLKYRSSYRITAGPKDGRNKDETNVYTRVGLFLRKNYLDEIPQIINILRGEMSFIGPRPERPEFVAELKSRIPFYEMRLLVPPGITGWAQIHMDNDASVEDAPEKMQYDLYYIKNRSLVLDLLIIIKTIFTLLQREGR